MRNHDSFVEHVVDLLSSTGPVRSRAMMGGHGVFCGDLCMALIVENRLYLKVDAETKDRFAAAGGEPFTYDRNGKAVAMSYWTPPEETVEDAEAIRPWAEMALEAAARSKKPKAAGGGAKGASAPKGAARKPGRTRTARNETARGPGRQRNAMHPRAQELVEQLGLEPHPEGGFFREIHRSEQRVRAACGERCGLTSILFLLPGGACSRWHRVLAADETWHLYEGDPLELFLADGELARTERRVLAPVGEGTSPVQVVPAGWWQAAQSSGAYTLVGCTVGPGFEFQDFALLADHPELAERLRRAAPQLASLI